MSHHGHSGRGGDGGGVDGGHRGLERIALPVLGLGLGLGLRLGLGLGLGLASRLVALRHAAIAVWNEIRSGGVPAARMRWSSACASRHAPAFSHAANAAL